MIKRVFRFSERLLAAISSKKFFWSVVGLLVIEALWIALSGHFPMAFDEDFHFGIIKIYAQHLSPFLASQPPHANAFGAVARDPSYLYHYLMSFPYRLIRLFTADQTIQVLCLRFINIVLFALSLPLYRRLLLHTGISRTLINSCLALFVLVPIVPQLAAQINYDNLLLPLTAGCLLLSVTFLERLKAYKRIDMKVLLQLTILCLLTSLVKYAFLPIFLGIVLVMVTYLVRTFGLTRKLWLTFAFSFTLIGRRLRVGLLLALFVSLGLFMQRDGLNLVRYHTPAPDCGQVLTVQQCSEYGAWIRDYIYANTKVNAPRSPLTFMQEWLYGMWLRLFFAVAGAQNHFETRGPFLLPSFGTVVFLVGGLALLLRYGKRIWRDYNHPVLWLLGVVSGLYIAILWLDEYRAFLRTGHPVAINGRYLLPVLLFVMLPLALAYAELVHNRPRLRVALASVLLLCFLWGGGALTYILRSNDAWYWPSPLVSHVNDGVKRAIGPAVPGYRYPTEFVR